MNPNITSRYLKFRVNVDISTARYFDGPIFRRFDIPTVRYFYDSLSKH